MNKHLEMVNGRKLILMDSISYITAEDAGQIIVSGSHGGLAAVEYSKKFPPYLVIFNDAGIGKDEAGIAGLAELDAASIAAATVHHTSARIGEANETWENGIISHVNSLAQMLGVSRSKHLRICIRTLANRD